MRLSRPITGLRPVKFRSDRVLSGGLYACVWRSSSPIAPDDRLPVGSNPWAAASLGDCPKRRSESQRSVFQVSGAILPDRFD